MAEIFEMGGFVGILPFHGPTQETPEVGFHILKL